MCAPPDRWNDFETGSGTVASSRRRTIDGVGASVAFVGAPVGAWRIAADKSGVVQSLRDIWGY